MRRRNIGGALLLVALVALVGCAGLPGTSRVAPLKEAARDTYAAIVHATYQDSLDGAVALQTAVERFVANPSDATLQAARQAWLAAREPYGQSEAFRFYGGPIDDEDGPEGFINGWPLDEAYLDYVEGAPTSGIVNDAATYPTIERERLLALNEQGAEENISLGFHAIEFLLWGQDLRADGAGDRPYTDYVASDANPSAARRARYLLLSSELLVEHLTAVTTDWAPDVAGNYRAQFLALPPDEALQRMLTGVGVLAKSELAGERLFTAYDNQDQEDEHSCFSDNTHRDIIQNARGIRNVYLGEYSRPDGTTVSGTGLDEVLAVVDPALNREVVALLDQAMADVQAIPVPFDQAILRPESRPQVLATVNTLQDLGDQVAQVAAALDLTINTALP